MSASVSIHYEVQRLPSSSVSDRKNPNRDLPRVRRSLFGPVDHTEMQRLLDAELATQTRNQSQKWEFDFVNEVPLSPLATKGRYVWNAVTPPPVSTKRRTSDEDNAHLYNTAELEEIANARKAEAEMKSVGTFRKQNLITDYLVVKKRSCPMSSAKKKRAKPTKMARTTQKDVAS